VAKANIDRKFRWLRPRFSLRALLVGVTVACLVGGYWMNRAIRQRTAVRRFYVLTAARTEPGYEDLVTMGYRYRGKDQYYKPIVPKWLHPWRDLVGEEAFGEVTGVQLIETAATDADLRLLRDVPTVERVLLSRTQVTDEGIGHLLECPKLRYLAFDGLPITDRGIARLTELTELDCLSLSGTKVTDGGLEHLARLPKLKELWLRNTAVTDAGFRRLQTALPGCRIQADVPASFQQQQRWMSGSPARW
jgi:hypothetical protein